MKHKKIMLLPLEYRLKLNLNYIYLCVVKYILFIRDNKCKISYLNGFIRDTC